MDTAFLQVLYVKSLLYKFWKFAFLQKSHILRLKMWASTSDAFPQFWSWGCEISCIWMVVGRIGHLWSYFVKEIASSGDYSAISGLWWPELIFTFFFISAVTKLSVHYKGHFFFSFVFLSFSILKLLFSKKGLS